MGASRSREPREGPEGRPGGPKDLKIVLGMGSLKPGLILSSLKKFDESAQGGPGGRGSQGSLGSQAPWGPLGPFLKLFLHYSNCFRRGLLDE